MDLATIIGIGVFLAAYVGTLIFGFNAGNKNSSYQSSYGPFSITEINLSKIILAFLKSKNYSEEKSESILLESFKTYSEKMFVEISVKKIRALIKNYSGKDINVNRTCNYISSYPTKIKLFLLYSLTDIAAADKIYSVEEEEFINNVRKRIRIPIQTFNAVKASYTKKGMKDERQIKAEQERKKIAQSYLPYNAYKILGITSEVTETELKKAYRTLAKKYHPDKYHGQSNEIIQKAEEKFEEITRAYKTIIIDKNF